MTIKWVLVLMGALSVANSQEGYGRDNPSNQLNYNPFGQLIADENELNGDEIPGEAGRDYPIYAEPPQTSFRCENQQFPGYYADPEAQCQAFYICQKGGKSDSFLCPNGTVFNQEFLVCDWWYNFDCNRAESLYSINEQIVRAMEEADSRIRQEKEQSGYDYNSQNGGYQNVGSNEGYQNSGANRQYQNDGIFGDYQNNGNIGGYQNVGNVEGYQNGKLNGAYQNGRNNGGQRYQQNINPVYGVPNSDQTQGFNFRQRNGNPSQSYGVPNLAEARNGNGGYNANGRSPSASYGVPEKYSSINGINGNSYKENGYSGYNRNSNNVKNGNGRSNNGFGFNGSRNNGFQNGNSRNGIDKTYLPPNFNSFNGGNGNFQAFRNGLGNGPSSFGSPNLSKTYLPAFK